ncbi:39S ribosomal protein L10, mitochondrial [Boleophthalmus pectinirostris]|uniref:39S ribosomal protein L10, mitochondrial n=1 Tax=Boleophthalmus pectinirostris TaxID=150288 RepID=UPI000A1C4062|nr:39S ribosomal protein L10, mitochondrial [Boleophthalmus pectinirostris]
MAATLCSKIIPKQGWRPLAQSVRHGSKAVTRHKKPMHFLKQKLMAVTEYIPPKPAAPKGAYPAETIQVKEESGLALLKKKQIKEAFQANKMIAVAQNSGSNVEDILILKYRLHKHNISVKFFPNEIMRSFLNDSKYCNMAPLFCGPTVLLVSKEPKVKELLKTVKGSPQITLLGGCVEDSILSTQGLLNYSKLPSLTVVQGELVSGLTMLTSQTAALLQRHPSHLSALLTQYLKQQSGDTEAATASGESS